MLERFTKRAKEVVVRARAQAQEEHSAQVRAHHLLLAMTQDPGCLAATALADLAVSAEQVRDAVRRQAAGPAGLDQGDVEALASIGIDVDEVLRRLDTGPVPALGEGPRRRVAFSAEGRKTLELALREARALHHDYLGTEHLLLGLLRDRGTSAAAALADCGVTHEAVRAAVVRALRGAG